MEPLAEPPADGADCATSKAATPIASIKIEIFVFMLLLLFLIFSCVFLFSNRNAISWNFVILSFDWICRAGFLSRPCNLQFSLIKVCALQF
jgi:hypothetical protein